MDHRRSHGAGSETYRYCPRCGGGLGRRVLKPGEPTRLVCADCEFVFYLDPKVAACTVSVLDGGIVLLRRSIDPGRGKWVFPGGFVDRGESVADAAVRETREEANLEVSLISVLDVYSYPGHEVVVVVYAAEVRGGELSAGDEADEARTFAPERIPWDELAFESTREALREYVRRFFPRARPTR